VAQDTQRFPAPAGEGSGRAIIRPRRSLPPGAVSVDPGTGLVSIVVRSAPLNQVLELLAEQLGLNMVVASDVTANVSVTLDRVPLEHALTHIVSVAGYTWVQDGDVILITSAAAGRNLAPYAQGRRVRVFPLDYVSATDTDLVIKGLLSPAGQSFVTQATDADNRKTQELIVVEDMPEHVARVEQFLRQVDVPPRQVLIEVHVMSIELQDDLEHGLNLEYLDALGLPEVTVRTQGFASVAEFTKGTSPAFYFNLSSGSLNTLLRALETTSDAKTLATPKVLALSGQQARIQIGGSFGYVVTTTTQTSTMESVEFMDTGVVLTVTPRVTNDGNVVMHVKPEVSEGEINGVTALPEEETTEIETDLMLPDGYGTVIGGLIQEADSESQSKIPLIGDLWLIGRLFQAREVKRNRTEIIIALVPHVVPYQPTRHQLECEQFQRASTPLVYGPLLQNPRPFEPQLPNAGHWPSPHYKQQHLHTLPTGESWAPRGPHDPCLPGAPQPVEMPEAPIPYPESLQPSPNPPASGELPPYTETLTPAPSPPTPNLPAPNLPNYGELPPAPVPSGFY